ncbi:hypothetical protein AB0068_29585, partial [Klebsiella pneumoniae]
RRTNRATHLVLKIRTASSYNTQNYSTQADTFNPLKRWCAYRFAAPWLLPASLPESASGLGLSVTIHWRGKS